MLYGNANLKNVIAIDSSCVLNSIWLFLRLNTHRNRPTVGLRLAYNLQHWTSIITTLVNFWCSHENISYKHKTSTKCWVNFGPPSVKLAQHWTNIGSMYLAWWEGVSHVDVDPWREPEKEVSVKWASRKLGRVSSTQSIWLGYWTIKAVYKLNLRARHKTDLSVSKSALSGANGGPWGPRRKWKYWERRQ